MDRGHSLEEQELSTAGSPHVRHSRLEVVDDPRGGFVLALVVLLLFGIGVAGAAGYQVVLSEALLSVHAKETQTALSIARAGLQSYMGKQIGVHEDTVTYSIEGGDAVVTARLVSEINDFETLYLLGSEGVYTDPTFTGSAARRTVYQYAVKREVALEHVAAVTQASGNVYVDDNARLWGNDQASVADCEQTSGDLVAVLMGSGGLSISGSPLNGSADSVTYGSYAAVLDSLGINWSVLTSTDFPVDYQNTWPSCGLPADSFTVTRWSGNLTVPSGACGRGVLIVGGRFTPGAAFTWNGVVLAGRITPDDDAFTINGLVVGGLDGLGSLTTYWANHYVYHNRCMAFKAGRRLSHFRPLGSTWWEEM